MIGPLYIIASKRGDLEVAKLLLEKGADINFQNTIGDTALHCACVWGHLDVVKLLLEKGADIEIKNVNGETTLHRASNDDPIEGNMSTYIETYLAVVKLLIEKGANV